MPWIFRLIAGAQISSPAGLVEAPLDAVAAGQAAGLPDLHEDPADRMIAATAMRLGAQLVTPEARS